MWGINPEKISVIYNSIEVQPQIGVQENKNEIVTVARLVPWKGISETIEATTIAQKEVPTVSLVIIGEGPDEVRLKKKGASFLGDAVSFTGVQSHENTLRAMNTASVFVLNSAY